MFRMGPLRTWIGTPWRLGMLRIPVMGSSTPAGSRLRVLPARGLAWLPPQRYLKPGRRQVPQLTRAVARQGTSFRDYKDPFGGRGGFLGLAKVYGRAGEPCVRCGTTLRATHRLEGRITVWCPECQR
jgi:formamidopyrimidine-DNA glycosylase